MGLFLHSGSTSELIPLLHSLILQSDLWFLSNLKSTSIFDSRLHHDLFSHYYYLIVLVLIGTWFMQPITGSTTIGLYELWTFCLIDEYREVSLSL